MGKRYAHYNKETKELINFTNTNPCIELTHEQWQEAITKGYNFVENGKLIFKDLRPQTDINKSNLERLQTIFYQKTVDLKAIACDKYGSNEYVEAQYQTYENMYLSATQGLFSPEENQEIITLNETAKAHSRPIAKELNEIRSALQKKIEASAEVQALLKEFEELKISFDVQPLKDFLVKVGV